MEVILIK